MPVASLFLKSYHRRLSRGRNLQCSSILFIGITLAIFCAQTIVAFPDVSSPIQNISDVNTTTSTTEVTDVGSSQEDDYYSEEEYNNGTSWRDGNWRRQDNSKIAQVVVYFCVIVIALAGVLIKYFVTQYENSQMKAQQKLDYQRLQNA